MNLIPAQHANYSIASLPPTPQLYSAFPTVNSPFVVREKTIGEIFGKHVLRPAIDLAQGGSRSALSTYRVFYHAFYHAFYRVFWERVNFNYSWTGDWSWRSKPVDDPQLCNGNFIVAMPEVLDIEQVEKSLKAFVEELIKLGNTALKDSQFFEAIGCFEHALSIGKEVYGDDDYTIALIFHKLGAAYTGGKNFEKAIEFLNQAITIWKKIYYNEHSLVGIGYHNLGSIYQDQGSFAQAVECYNQALTIQKKLFGEVHLTVAIILYDLGLAHYKQRDFAKAIEFLKQVMTIRERLSLDYHPMDGETLTLLHAAYADQENITTLIDIPTAA